MTKRGPHGEATTSFSGTRTTVPFERTMSIGVLVTAVAFDFRKTWVEVETQTRTEEKRYVPSAAPIQTKSTITLSYFLHASNQ